MARVACFLSCMMQSSCILLPPLASLMGEQLLPMRLTFAAFILFLAFLVAFVAGPLVFSCVDDEEHRAKKFSFSFVPFFRCSDCWRVLYPRSPAVETQSIAS